MKNKIKYYFTINLLINIIIKNNMIKYDEIWRVFK